MKALATLLLIFLYEVGTAVALPTRSEVPVLGSSPIPIGWIFAFAVAGRIVGSYLVFFIGDRAKGTDRFKRMVARYRWLAATMAWSERFVDRYGIPAVFALLSVPGLPDTAPLYLFALVSKRPVVFALAAGLGTGVRMILVLFGIRLLLGPNA